MAQPYALLDAAGVWQNTIAWDGVTLYAPPSGWTLASVASLPAGGALGATLANGTWTLPAPVAIVPKSVAMWQAQTALQAAGLLTQANTAIAALNNPAVTNFWAHAQTLDRADPILASVAASLNLTSAQLDQLFVQAGAISI